MKKFLMAALATTVMTAAVQASAQVSPEDQIKFRKAGYSFMSWNMGKIKAQVIDGSVEYNQQQILAAANAIAAIGSSGMGALYGPGTDRDVGSQTTRVKPELFENFPDVAQLSGDFVEAANNLVAQAESGDQAAIRTAFGRLGETCKSCHDKYRKD
ncbi:MAG: cytochrome c [Halopseudomonas yangmingensis]|uniref:Cytochrome c556 n=2 Tax=Halopseudomonas yangmingensis TaxID=1720063 RepID=A0A1I4S242_9GAMM|nr:cytochrome c [Halopseudomonas yangmingensis]SFM58489.1 Cytochrome c556 [Halopseudomonas yangmingensis]